MKKICPETPWLLALAAGVALAILWPDAANAKLEAVDKGTNTHILDSVLIEFEAITRTWETIIMGYARRLFVILGTIALAWTMGQLALKRADIGEFFGEFIRFILFFGFFLWLLENGPAIAVSFIESFRQIGGEASGTGTTTPSKTVDLGFEIVAKSVEALGWSAPGSGFVIIILSFGILILLALISLNLLMVMVSAWILAFAGIFVLGFGASRWTSDMAIHYFKSVLGIGLQIMTMLLIIGVGDNIFETMHGRLSKGPMEITEMAVLMVVALAIFLLVSKVPPMISGLVTGASLGDTGVGAFGGGGAVGAVVGGAAVAKLGASRAVGAVKGGVTLAKAVKTAHGNVSGAGNLFKKKATAGAIAKETWNVLRQHKAGGK